MCPQDLTPERERNYVTCRQNQPGRLLGSCFVSLSSHVNPAAPLCIPLWCHYCTELYGNRSPHREHEARSRIVVRQLRWRVGGHLVLRADELCLIDEKMASNGRKEEESKSGSFERGLLNLALIVASVTSPYFRLLSGNQVVSWLVQTSTRLVTFCWASFRGRRTRYIWILIKDAEISKKGLNAIEIWNELIWIFLSVTISVA